MLPHWHLPLHGTVLVSVWSRLPYLPKSLSSSLNVERRFWTNATGISVLPKNILVFNTSTRESVSSACWFHTVCMLHCGFRVGEDGWQTRREQGWGGTKRQNLFLRNLQSGWGYEICSQRVGWVGEDGKVAGGGQFGVFDFVNLW